VSHTETINTGCGLHINTGRGKSVSVCRRFREIFAFGMLMDFFSPGTVPQITPSPPSAPNSIPSTKPTLDAKRLNLQSVATRSRSGASTRKSNVPTVHCVHRCAH
jgi:hypothetical protein